MNSLEFIKRRIEFYQDFKKEKEIELRNTDANIMDKMMLLTNISSINLNLQTLQQIKTELEAWEVVKNKGVDMFMYFLYYNDLEEYNDYIKSTLEGEVSDYKKCILTEEDDQKLKKALEVKE